MPISDRQGKTTLDQITVHIPVELNFKTSCFIISCKPHVLTDSSVPANADLSPSSSRPKLKYPPSTRMSVPVPQLTIIMSVISSVIALIIFGAIVTCIHRKRHRSSTAAFDSIELRNDWEIRRGDLFMLDKIGQGAFGVVLKAQLYCKSLPRSSLHDPDWENKKIVACKMVKGRPLFYAPKGSSTVFTIRQPGLLNFHAIMRHICRNRSGA